MFVLAQLVSPGAWLCDLTLERYEVREKKISKKVTVVILSNHSLVDLDPVVAKKFVVSAVAFLFFIFLNNKRFSIPELI